MKKKEGNKGKNNKNGKNNHTKHPIFKMPRTLGQKSADNLAKWAGSWTFIILFFIFLGIWMVTNGLFLLKSLGGQLEDPYPYILLNLALSCLAAIQAPIILMSQNRQAQRDRLQMEYDYAINRKAEQEIRQIKNMLSKILIKKKK